jgi:hypothetical protein
MRILDIKDAVVNINNCIVDINNWGLKAKSARHIHPGVDKLVPASAGG